jgi:hypothetical protein
MPKKTPPKQPSKKTIKSDQATASENALKRRLQSHREDKTKIRANHNKLTGSFRLFRDSVSMVRQHWKLFGWMVLVYLVMSVALIGVGGSGTNLNQMKTQLSSAGLNNSIGLNVALFSSMLGQDPSSSEAGTVYRPIVFVIMSLATIWALRQLMAGKKIGVRDPFYKGMYPLIPVILVILAIGLQIVPIAISSFLLSLVTSGTLAVGIIEQAFWAIVLFALALASLYMLTASIFALYIVTLPDTWPFAALRSARTLVRFRRWTVMRKLLFLPVALLVINAAVTLPFIWLVPFLAQWVLLLSSMISLIVGHTYIYSLYRELL